MFALPASLELWVFVTYGAGLLLLARLLETLARLHFQRANQFAEAGFSYDHGLDQYRCPEGSYLARHAVDLRRRLAVYRAPASDCNRCHCKHACTPHDHGRHIYRSLAVWSETDLCRFHQRLSATMLAIGALLSLVTAIHWHRQPGWGLAAVVAVIDAVCLTIELRRIVRARSALAALEGSDRESGSAAPVSVASGAKAGTMANPAVAFTLRQASLAEPVRAVDDATALRHLDADPEDGGGRQNRVGQRE